MIEKIMYDIIRCIIFFFIPLFLTYLLGIIKSINKREKEKTELVSLESINEIIKTVVMSLEQTNVKKNKGVDNKLNYDQQIHTKNMAKIKVNNILQRNEKFDYRLYNINLEEYINTMIERKVLELSMENKK